MRIQKTLTLAIGTLLLGVALPSLAQADTTTAKTRPNMALQHDQVFDVVTDEREPSSAQDEAKCPTEDNRQVFHTPRGWE